MKKQTKLDFVLDTMKGDLSVSLSKEEQMRLIYHPLFNAEKQEIEQDAYYIIRSLQESADESLKANLSVMIYVLIRRFLSPEGERKIWEVLIRMSFVEKEIQKMFNQEMKDRTFKRLVKAIKENKSKDVIEEIIEIGSLSREDVEEAARIAGREGDDS